MMWPVLLQTMRFLKAHKTSLKPRQQATLVMALFWTSSNQRSRTTLTTTISSITISWPCTSRARWTSIAAKFKMQSQVYTPSRTSSRMIGAKCATSIDSWKQRFLRDYKLRSTVSKTLRIHFIMPRSTASRLSSWMIRIHLKWVSLHFCQLSVHFTWCWSERVAWLSITKSSHHLSESLFQWLYRSRLMRCSWAKVPFATNSKLSLVGFLYFGWAQERMCNFWQFINLKGMRNQIFK